MMQFLEYKDLYHRKFLTVDGEINIICGFTKSKGTNTKHRSVFIPSTNELIQYFEDSHIVYSKDHGLKYIAHIFNTGEVINYTLDSSGEIQEVMTFEHGAY